MKVLYFHQHFSTPAGSTGQRSYEMARGLVSRGHQVTMVCGSYRGGSTGLKNSFIRGIRQGIVDEIHVIEFDLTYSNNDGLIKRSWIFFKFALYSVKLALSLTYDLVFATSTPLTAGIPGILARWFRGKPFVFEVRDLWPELPKAMGVVTNPLVLGGLSLLEKLSYYSAQNIIGLSPGMVKGIAQRGVNENQVKMVSNGCDLDLFKCDLQISRPKGVRATDLMVIYAGTHGIANGLSAVLDAARVLKSRDRNDIKLVLIGEGKLKRALQERAQKESLSNIIIFLDAVPKQQLATLMASADIGMQVLANVPAFYDGTSPNKFFDYIAAGLPVLNNYPGWLAEKIIQYDCGFIVPPDEPKLFADTLEFAASNRDILKSMGDRARQLAENEFNRSLLVKQWVDILEATAI